MALDCGLNITGLAITTAQGFFVTYCITFTFLLLCLVPFWVQLVTGCDILGTRVYQVYVETLLQTLDGIIVNQPKRFLPLAEEAKHIAEEIRIEKINEQWAGIPREQLLNQSFTDQLNFIQILEQLAPLQLAKEHLPGNIVGILERLGKVDNIPFNQLYYIAENCADRYYSKVIETFISILKHQFADCQLLLVNTA